MKTNIWTTPSKKLHKELKKIIISKKKLKELKESKASYNGSRKNHALKFGKVIR